MILTNISHLTSWDDLKAAAESNLIGGAIYRDGMDIQWLSANELFVDETTIDVTAFEAAFSNQDVSALETAASFNGLREERDKRLTQTDWWVLRGNMTAEQEAYRQALRDLPANTADPAHPVWPIKPGGTN